jgi:hypothetical protein
MSNATASKTMLQELVFKKLTAEELNWFTNKSQLIEKDELGNQFILFYSLVFRFISNDVIEWDSKELQYLIEQYPYFSESQWNKQSLCRALLMANLPAKNSKAILKNLFETCSVKEQVDFYKSLFFLEKADTFVSLAEEGVRTNVTDVFDAIALNNPYAANFLSEEAWNQLVLKAIFMGRPLYKIYNIFERKNQKLALVLNDYIQERWSAGRTVSPEVWQLMSGYNNPELQETLKKAVVSTNALECRAAKIVLEDVYPNTPENKSIWVEIGKQFNN